MLSLEKCKNILNKNGNNYSVSEIEQIRDLLTKLAEIDYKLLNQQTNEGNHIHSGINRRTGR